MRAHALGVIGNLGDQKCVQNVENYREAGISDISTYFEFAAKNNAKCLNSNF